MNLFRELYHGNVCPDTCSCAQDPAYRAAVRKRQEVADKLTAQLTEEQKALFDEYEEAASDVSDIARYNTFTYAFRFGTLLMTEVFMGGDEDTGDE